VQVRYCTSLTTATKKNKDKMAVNITGLDKKEVIRALWENSKVAPMYMGFGVLSEVDLENACKKDRIDYLCGRVMKINVNKDEVDPHLYDRDNGAGAFKKVIDDLRSKQ
jgi:hypothetical protein